MVYRNDAVARERRLSPEARLRFHQEGSGPTMRALREWLGRQLGEKRTEPNSALGGAIGYTLKHWEELTLFLRQAGAPLDNNVCERALKKAILHRKNALFYKTRDGAQGDGLGEGGADAPGNNPGRSEADPVALEWVGATVPRTEFGHLRVNRR